MRDQKCEMNELFIEQFIDNELDFEESAKISTHIESCPSCKKIYDELKFIRNIISDMHKADTLSPIEKEGFYNLIDKEKKHKWRRKLFSEFFYRPVVLTFSISFVLFAAVFSIMLFAAGSDSELIIQEIMSAHNNNFPDEFNITESSGSIVKDPLKQLDIDKKVIRELSRISPVLKGRYTSIATLPMAKIKLQNKNGKGTLFLSKKDDRIKNVFEDARCIVKHKDGKLCKASTYHENGKDIVYWDSQDNEYVFVSDDQHLHSKMIHLINNHY